MDKITETMQVVAFGFPFGKLLDSDANPYPAVSINVGSVTALREKAWAPHRIQVDAVLNPGNSGGPVLGPDGKVIGVVVAGVRGAGVNFVIPVSHLSAFLAKPEFDFQPAAVTRATVNTPSGKGARSDEGRIRAAAVAHGVTCITTLAAAQAAVEACRCCTNGS